jgi:Mg-chelatase subunit ChlD
LLDRSGSMSSMVDDVIGGFNRFLADQQADGPDARMTLVQFDSQDPQEILTDALTIQRVRALTNRTFEPRGGTPLLDATGRLIARAAARAQDRRQLGKRPEEIVFVTVTDGEENQSREYDRRTIRRLVSEKSAEGWTFVFLSAGLDAYAEAGSLGYDTRAVQAWAPDGAGATMAFEDLSKATSTRRSAVRAGAPMPAAAKADYFPGGKAAEADKVRRGR